MMFRLPVSGAAGPQCSTLAISRADRMIVSEKRNPLASSSSLPGVRIVMEILRAVWPSGVAYPSRISRGSSAATRSAVDFAELPQIFSSLIAWLLAVISYQFGVTTWQYIPVTRDAGRNENRSHNLSFFIRISRYARVQKSSLNSALIQYCLLQKKIVKEIHLSTIPRRKFIQMSALGAAAYFVHPGDEAQASEPPRLSPDDPMAKAMKYTHDASTVDPASRPNPAAEQTCANCALLQGPVGAQWRPCQIFPGKTVAAAGWCSVWAPKA